MCRLPGYRRVLALQPPCHSIPPHSLASLCLCVYLLLQGHMLVFALLTKDRHVPEPRSRTWSPGGRCEAECGEFSWDSAGPGTAQVLDQTATVWSCSGNLSLPARRSPVPEHIHQGRRCCSELLWQGLGPSLSHGRAQVLTIEVTGLFLLPAPLSDAWLG